MDNILLHQTKGLKCQYILGGRPNVDKTQLFILLFL